MEENNFFIKKGYRSCKDNLISSQKDSKIYWTEERIFFQKYLQYHVYEFAQKIVKENHIKNVIDIGCGLATKLMKLIFPFCQDITGIDLEEAISYCKNKNNAGNFIVDNLENPVTNPGVFDLVICADVIEHLLNPDKLLEFIKKVSHKDNFIILSTPERDILRGKDCMASNKPEHIREWNQEEFFAYLTNRGFMILDHKLLPFAKFSLNIKILKLRRIIKKQTGTVKTVQLVLCKSID